MNTTEFNTNNPAIYRATAKLWEAINDDAVPESVRSAIIADVANEISNIVAQLDFSRREVITQLYPLCIELSRIASHDPPPPGSLAAKVADAREWRDRMRRAA